ncbi:glycosyltransferase [Nocardia sp. N13]|uniref:glycosyltransferase n=1 Tax=Nocardioides sp. N13(2025) TaxID=3453405 RepID=UPI003F7587B2
MRIRDFLERSGCEVTVWNVEFPHSSVLESRSMMRRAREHAGQFDLVICAEFSLQLAAAAWFVARWSSAKLLIDFFVGLYETHVLDSQRVQKGSFKAVTYWALDWIGLNLGDYVVTDTLPRASHLQRRRIRRGSVQHLPVGAPEWAIPAEFSPHDVPRILYYGNFVALHGFPTLLSGLNELQSRLDFEFVVVGPRFKGSDYDPDLKRYGLMPRTILKDSIPEDLLQREIGRSDVVLGVFGSSRKAKTVVPNKVYQGLAMGKTVVTRASEAYAEMRPLFDGTLIEVHDLSPAGIADGLEVAVGRAMESSDLSGSLPHHRVSDYVDAQFVTVWCQILA